MRLFAFDFETFLIAPWLQAPPLVCMSYAIDDDEPGLERVQSPRFWQLLWDALHDDECVMVAHNAAFEITCLLASVGHIRAWRKAIFAKLKRGGFVCTLLADRLIRIGRGITNDELGLDDCMDFNHLPHKLDKKCWWRLRYGTLFNVPLEAWPREAVDYALGDTCVRELWRSQDRPEYKRFLVALKDQLEADVFLRLSTCWGFETDVEQAKIMYADTKKRLKRDEVILKGEGLITWAKCDGVFRYKKNTKSAKARIEAAYEKIGAEAPRGGLTPSMLVKAYKKAGFGDVEFEGKEVKQSDIEEALMNGVPAELLEGNVSLDEESCLGIRLIDPIMESYTRYAQASTLFGKVKRLQNPIIQASFLVLGAATTRTSCRQGEDPDPGEAWMAWGLQLQNPPRAAGIRESLRARIRRAIVSCDFDTFELRTLTQQAYRLHLQDPDRHPYPLMLAVLNDPKRDVHVELGAQVYGMTAAEAYALKKTNKKLYKDLRQVAKALNFGAPGGLGKKTFVEFARTNYDLIITEDRAEELLEIWKDTWPEMRAYLDWASRQLREADPNSYKEKRKARGESVIMGTEIVRGQTSYCDFCNNQFQGLAASAAKAGFVALGYAMYDDEDSGVFGCRMVAFLHDEVLVEVPLDTLHDTSHRVAEIFVAGAQKLVPDVMLTSSPAACYNWSKAAGDPVYMDGKLAVWEDYVTSEVERTGKFDGIDPADAQGLVREASKISQDAGEQVEAKLKMIAFCQRVSAIRKRELLAA